MEMPAGIAATIERLAAIVGSRATTVYGVMDQLGRSEAYHAPRSPDVVAFPGTMQEVHPSLDLRA